MRRDRKEQHMEEGESIHPNGGGGASVGQGEDDTWEIKGRRHITGERQGEKSEETGGKWAILIQTSSWTHLKPRKATLHSRTGMCGGLIVPGTRTGMCGSRAPGTV